MRYFVSYTNSDGTPDSMFAESRNDLADVLQWLKSIGAVVSSVAEVSE